MCAEGSSCCTMCRTPEHGLHLGHGRDGANLRAEEADEAHGRVAAGPDAAYLGLVRRPYGRSSSITERPPSRARSAAAAAVALCSSKNLKLLLVAGSEDDDIRLDDFVP